jgi:hypothetical protein
MSHLEQHEGTQSLVPVLFPGDSQERRTGRRIPLGGVVRMGPPSGEPYATVSARDLSTGGLFIDADRPVKIGARFSAEIVLPSGGKLYVPEAEVAYNREHAHGSGFGVRFVDPPRDIVEAIERELSSMKGARARIPSLPPLSQLEVVETKPAEENATEILVRDTLPPRPRIEVDESELAEPAFGDDEAFEVESEMPREERREWLEALMRVGHEAKERVLARSRRVPLLWTSLAVFGSAMVASAVGLALWSGSRAEAVEPAAIEDRGVSATTHRVLVEEQKQPELIVAAPKAEPRVAEAKKPLPPLVYVEELAKAKPETKTPPVQVKRETAQPKVEKNAKAKIAVAANAKVLKTHVLRAPDRFVIDLVGQDQAPAFPAFGGAIKNIRFGKHPEYSRLVIETNAPIEMGRASKNGRDLTIQLELKR